MKLWKGIVIGALATAVALVATSAFAGTGIGDVFNLGESNTVNAQSSLSGSTATPQLRVINSDPSGSGVRATHSGTTGSAAGVWGDTSSTGSNATGVFGSVTSSSANGLSNGVRGQNNGAGRGVYGQGTDGPGVYGNSKNQYGVWGIGSYGVVASGSTGAIWASTDNGSGTSIYGQNTGSGRGVHGKSASGVGVYGESTYQAGVSGFSNSFDGVYGDSHGANSAGVSGHGNRFGVWGRGQIGVHGESSNGEYAFDANGDVRQSAGGGGWVKAMAYIDPDRAAGQQVVNCFNSQASLGAAHCGITATGTAVGQWTIDFGFDVTGRFAMVTPLVEESTCGAECGVDGNATLGSTFAKVELHHTDASLTNDGFYIFVF